MNGFSLSKVGVACVYVCTETQGDDVKLKVFTVMSAAYGGHALRPLISVCP